MSVKKLAKNGNALEKQDADHVYQQQSVYRPLSSEQEENLGVRRIRSAWSSPHSSFESTPRPVWPFVVASVQAFRLPWLLTNKIPKLTGNQTLRYHGKVPD